MKTKNFFSIGAVILICLFASCGGDDAGTDLIGGPVKGYPQYVYSCNLDCTDCTIRDLNSRPVTITPLHSHERAMRNVVEDCKTKSAEWWRQFSHRICNEPCTICYDIARSGDTLKLITPDNPNFEWLSCGMGGECEPCPKWEWENELPDDNFWDNQNLSNRPMVRFSAQKQNANHISVNVDDSALINVGISFDAELYSRYEARVASDSREIIAISYARENTPMAVATLVPEASRLLRVYGLSEGIGSIEIWAINSFGEEVCIAGDEIIHGGTAIFDKLVVEVTP